MNTSSSSTRTGHPRTPPGLAHGPLLAGLALGLLCAAWPAAQAQTNPREADRLQRMQRNLQQVQQERDAARAEAEALRREQQAQTQAAEAGRARLGSLQAEARRNRETSLQWQAQAEQLQAALAQARAAAGDAERTHAEALAQAARDQARLQAELQGLRQTNQALVARLGASNQAQADLKDRVLQLHALGLELLDQYRSAEGPNAWTAGSGVLGLSQVRREDRAEQARKRLDQLLVPQADAAVFAPSKP
jgi:hypothetical protein